MTEWENKTVLVTGATGLIGSHLVASLINKGAHVKAMGRSRLKLEQVFAEQINSENLELIEGNISKEMPEEICNIDFVFHAASPISGVEIKEKPVDTIIANLSGTQNCLEFIRKQGYGRLIAFSSATVYGNLEDKDAVVSEEDTSRADALHTGNAPYSESKRMIEVLARAYKKQYSVDSVIVRIGYVYGFIKPNPNTAFYEFINKATSGQDIVLNNSGMGRRDNIHVDDVIRGLEIVAQKGLSGESYNLSSNGEGNNYSAIDEIAQIIANASNEINKAKVNVRIKPIEDERKPGMRLDNSKAKLLGWNIEVALEEGIRDTVKKFIG